MFEGEAPRWIPDAVYRRVFDRLYSRLRERLAAMAADPDDQSRRQFDAWIAGLPDRLETSPDLRERGERIKRDVLRSAGLRDWSSSLWQKAKEALRVQAADPDSELRHRMTGLLVGAGAAPRLRPAPPGRPRADGRVGCPRLADQFHGELAGLVTGTIERWAPPRRRSSWNCCLAATCSTSGSTARWSGQAWAWPCTPSSWPWPDPGPARLARPWSARAWSPRHASLTSACQVCAPTIPSTRKPATSAAIAFWKARTDASVFGPNRPSTARVRPSFRFRKLTRSWTAAPPVRRCRDAP